MAKKQYHPLGSIMSPQKTTSPVNLATDPRENFRGTMAGFAAFFVWGLLVLYWKLLHHLPALEQMSHRIVWSAVVLVPLIVFTGGLPKLIETLRSASCMFRLAASAATLGINWYLFIWAVEHNRILDSSLGYFINPLMNALLGWLFLRERTSRLQGLGVALAAFGVALSVMAYGDIPFLPLSMALTFSLYGFIRKTTNVGPTTGLFIESLFMLPVGLGYLYWHYHGGAPLPDKQTMFILLWAGPLTLLPLLLFAYAARRVQLLTLGLTQYTSPTISFLLGIFVFHEQLKSSSLITFGFIWVGLAVFSYAGWRNHQMLMRIARNRESS